MNSTTDPFFRQAAQQLNTEKLTVSRAVQSFLYDRELTPNTRKTYKSNLRRFRRAYGNHPVQKVDGDLMKLYLDGLRSAQGDVLAPSTYNRHFNTLRTFFNWVAQFHKLKRGSPMQGLEPKRLPDRLPRDLTISVQERIFRRITSLRDRALFTLLLEAGLRINEALSLDIEDLKLGEGRIRVLGKGGTEREAYPSKEAIRYVKRYVKERGRPLSGPLFVSRQGRLSYDMAYRLFRRYTDGITDQGKPLSIHQLRHTYGSRRAGKMDALILRDLMGHKSLRTTQQYARVNPSVLQKAVRRYEIGEGVS